MAEITNSSHNHKGKVRARRLSTRVDMTPMVDLAFLLLTFFILTSSFLKSSIMQLDLPDSKSNLSQPVSETNVLNVVLAENNAIFWWKGGDIIPKIASYASLRNVLHSERKANKKLVVLIKPKDESKYETLIDVLDEISILGIERYAIADFTTEDQELIETAQR